MEFFKRSPAFFACFTLLCLVSFSGGVWGIILGKQIESSESEMGVYNTRLQGLVSSLVDFAHLKASEDLLSRLELERSKLHEHLFNFSQRLELNACPKKSADMYYDLVAYCAELEQRAGATLSLDSEVLGIIYPDGFYWGFQHVLKSGALLDSDDENLRNLHQQKVILSEVLPTLIDGGPYSIDRIECGGRRMDESSGFEVQCFSIDFHGYTESLRRFLNSLISLPFSIVLEGVSVASVPRMNPRSRAKGNMEAVFDYGNGDGQERVVVEPDVSLFIIEFQCVVSEAMSKSRDVDLSLAREDIQLERPVEWSGLLTQTQQGFPVFDMFTPPQVFWNRFEQKFVFERAEEQLAGPGFGLVLKKLEQQPYRVQFEAYFDAVDGSVEGTLVQFYDRERCELIRGRVGDVFERSGFKLIDFKVELVGGGMQGSASYEKQAIVTVLDLRRSGYVVELRMGEPHYSEDFFEISMQTINPLPEAIIRWKELGEQVFLGARCFELSAVDWDEQRVYVAKLEDGERRVRSFSLGVGN